MGRTVSTPRDARHVLYLSWIPDKDDIKERLVEDYATVGDGLCRHDLAAMEQLVIQDEWDYVVEDYVLNVLGKFQSVLPYDGWADQEDRIVARNALAEFGISEYCGLAALWVRVRPDHDGTVGLAYQWIENVWPIVEAQYPNRLIKRGTFSNGEAVYSGVTT